MPLLMNISIFWRDTQLLSERQQKEIIMNAAEVSHFSYLYRDQLLKRSPSFQCILIMCGNSRTQPLTQRIRVRGIRRLSAYTCGPHGTFISRNHNLKSESETAKRRCFEGQGFCPN